MSSAASLAVPPEDVRLPFTLRRRAAFVVRYGLLKTVLLPRDVRSPRLRMLAYEIVYSLCRAVRRPPLPMRFLRITSIESIFGIFHVRAGTIDVACASPAFERPDVDHLLAELHRLDAAGRDVTFVDVGADIGTFSVTVGNRIPRARLLAFEPSSSSAALLSRNAAANALAVDIRRRALGDGTVAHAVLTFDVAEPGCSGLNPALLRVGEGGARAFHEKVPVTTLDAELADSPVLDVLVLKLDVEGAEVAVLDGARESLARARDTLLLVEDFVEPRVVARLRADGWTFVTKLTPYNSFWRRTGTRAR